MLEVSFDTIWDCPENFPNLMMFGVGPMGGTYVMSRAPTNGINALINEVRKLPGPLPP